MKILQLLVTFLFLVLFLVGCKQKEQVSNIDTATHCPNEVHLFSVADSLKKIKIDYHLKDEALLNSIEKKLGKNLCGTTTNFGLVLENETIIHMYVQKECADSGVICFRRPKEAQVLLNNKGMLLMAHELVSIDSIQQWMRKNYSKKTYGYTQTSIQWMSKTPKDSIEKVFTNILEGYKLVHEDVSEQLFFKKICDLNTTQLERLKEELPVKIRLEFIQLIIDPPPPPPIEVIEEK